MRRGAEHERFAWLVGVAVVAKVEAEGLAGDDGGFDVAVAQVAFHCPPSGSGVPEVAGVVGFLVEVVRDDPGGCLTVVGVAGEGGHVDAEDFVSDSAVALCCHEHADRQGRVHFAEGVDEVLNGGHGIVRSYQWCGVRIFAGWWDTLPRQGAGRPRGSWSGVGLGALFEETLERLDVGLLLLDELVEGLAMRSLFHLVLRRESVDGCGEFLDRQVGFAL